MAVNLYKKNLTGGGLGAALLARAARGATAVDVGEKQPTLSDDESPLSNSHDSATFHA